MAEIEETLLKRKIDSYSCKLEDFQAENELTVEITLNEYRDLIKERAIAEYKINEANRDKYRRDDENKKLKQKNEELKIKLFDYRKLYGELEKITEDDEEEE